MDLEEDTLYSLKWYLNGSEVASYMPLRNQSFEVFSTNYVPIKITPDSSSTNDLILSDVSWSCEGTWICEVFADKSFQKDEKIVQMTVIGELAPSESQGESYSTQRVDRIYVTFTPQLLQQRAQSFRVTMMSTT